MNFTRSLVSALGVLCYFLLLLPVVCAENILFIGNSFTSANDLPKLLEVMTSHAGKTVAVMAVTADGKDWAYHLTAPATDAALGSQAWDWVVLQDQSVSATHLRPAGEFAHSGQAFYDRIAQKSPAAGMLLYETWAYSARHPIFNNTTSAPALFSGPEQMYSEIHSNYAALRTLLQATDSKRKVLVAPVGSAFARCIRDHPEINLYAPDFKHPSLAGSYLSTAVIYATLFSNPAEFIPSSRLLDPQQTKLLLALAFQTAKAPPSVP